MKPSRRLTCTISPQVGIYRRKLPGSLTSFSSKEGRALFRECLIEGGCEGYFGLAEQFNTQNEPAYCGLGSLSIVLNTLNVENRTEVKKIGVQHVTEESLDVHIPLEVVRKKGITFEEFQCMAELNGAKSTPKRAPLHSCEELTNDLVKATMTPNPTEAIVATFSRGYLGQTGDGHFSPLAAFHASKKLVLILDTARFKYPPYWVHIEELWKSMDQVDPVTNLTRGWFVIEKNRTPCLTGLARSSADWGSVHAMVNTVIPNALHSSASAAEGVLSGLSSDPSFLSSLLTTHEIYTQEDLEGAEAPLTYLYKDLRRQACFKVAQSILSNTHHPWPSVEYAALLLAAWPVPHDTSCDLELKGLQSTAGFSPLLLNEVESIRNRLVMMAGLRCGCHI